MHTSLRNSILSILAGIAAAIIAVSCNTNGCTDNRSSIPLAQFYSSGSMKAIMLDSLEITGIDAPDTVPLLAAGTRTAEIYLPMRAERTNTSWCLSYRWAALNNPAYNDTLSFDYEVLPYFASNECGAMYRYRITHVDYTRHLVDSVGVVDSLITNINEPDIFIYFRTDDNARSTSDTEAKISLR